MPGLLTACLVVRDEETHLGACLDVLTPFVDEVVVVDTGSVDATVAVATARGARTARSAWADDFALARNAALDLARTPWVLSVDADERTGGDPTRLRRHLAATPPDVEAFSVLFTDADARSGAYTFRSPRLFRRDGVRWSGRVHERPVRDGVDVACAVLDVDLLTLDHLGYRDLDTVRVKAVRNLELARRHVADLLDAGGTSPDLALALLDLGRSAVSAGEWQTAVDALESVREVAVDGPVRRRATDFLARVMVVAGEHDLALHLAGELTATGADASWVRWLSAQAHGLAGRPGAALAALDGIGVLRDTAGCVHDTALVQQLRALCRQLLAVRAAPVG